MATVDERAIPDSLYPSASQKGEAIPLDIARPLKAYYSQLPVNQVAEITLADTRFNVSSVYSDVLCRLNTAPDNASPKTFILLPGMIYQLLLDKNVYFENLGTDAGIVVINTITRWDQLGNVGGYGVSR